MQNIANKLNILHLKTQNYNWKKITPCANMRYGVSASPIYIQDPILVIMVPAVAQAHNIRCPIDDARPWKAQCWSQRQICFRQSYAAFHWVHLTFVDHVTSFKLAAEIPQHYEYQVCTWQKVDEPLSKSTPWTIKNILVMWTNLYRELYIFQIGQYS